MEIVVRLNAEATEALVSKVDASLCLKELYGILDRYQLEMRPQHPGESDVTLSCYFSLDVESPVQATQVAKALQAVDVVEAAYTKPDAEVP